MTISAGTWPSRPVLFINPRSGSGKAQQHDLVGHCREKGIEPIVLEQGDDLASLVATAVSSGADSIGMAGGDGSQPQGGGRSRRARPPIRLRAGGDTQSLCPGHRHRPRRCRRRPRRLPPRARASHRPGPGQRSCLCEQCLHGPLRQDRPIAGVPRCQAPYGHRDAPRSARPER